MTTDTTRLTEAIAAMRAAVGGTEREARDGTPLGLRFAQAHEYKAGRALLGALEGVLRRDGAIEDAIAVLDTREELGMESDTEAPTDDLPPTMSAAASEYERASAAYRARYFSLSAEEQAASGERMRNAFVNYPPDGPTGKKGARA